MQILGSPASWHRLATRLSMRRRLTVAALSGLAVVCGLSAVHPPRVPTRNVVIAARDLSGGAPVAADDIRLAPFPANDVPSGALTAEPSVVGRLLAAPMRRGEPMTDLRLLSPALLAATDQSGAVAVPVRLADPAAAAALVHAGDTVDVIAAADPASGSPQAGSVVVHDVRVLATPVTSDAGNDGGSAGAGLVIVAATARQAAALAQAGSAAQLSVAVRPPSATATQ
jgi:Flp pilus assembly protein CpaB